MNASTSEGQMVVNGMSLSGRRGRNANSALVVSVGPQDYAAEDPLAGLAYQKRYEQLAFRTGQGQIPVQLYGDLTAGRISQGFGNVLPDIKGAFRFASLKEVLPEAAAIVSIIAAIVVYSLTLLLTGGIEEEALLHFPGGTRLAAAAKRLHLLRG